MGNHASSTSVVQNINNQLYVNKSTVTQVNQQLNEVIAKTVVKNAMESGGAIINKQELIFSHLTSKGDVDIGDISQKQVAAITFSAMNHTQARNDAALQFIQQAMLDLKSNVSADVVSKMEGTADTKLKTGFLSSLPLSQTNAKAETVNVSNVTTITDDVRNISNILQNRVENTFITETLTSCIMKINNAQLFKIQDVETTEGTIRIHNVTQDQAATAISQCQSITGATNQIINDTLSALDVKVDDTNSVKTEIDQSGKTTSSTESSGFFEGLSKIFSLDNLFSILVIGGIAIILVIVLIVVLTKMSGKSVSVPSAPVLPRSRVSVR